MNGLHDSAFTILHHLSAVNGAVRGVQAAPAGSNWSSAAPALGIFGLIRPVWRRTRGTQAALKRMDALDPAEFDRRVRLALSQVPAFASADVVVEHRRVRLGMRPLAAMTAVPKQDRAGTPVMVTNRTLTPSARKYARAHRLRVIERNALVGLLRRSLQHEVGQAAAPVPTNDEALTAIQTAA